MNKVELIGEVTKVKSGHGKSMAWAFIGVKAEHDGRAYTYDVKSFGEVAEKIAFGAAEGGNIAVVGHLSREKDRNDPARWETVVVADKVSFPSGAEEDIPF